MSIIREFKVFDCLFILLFVCICLALSACDGTDEEADKDKEINIKPSEELCAVLDGRTYLSDSLGEGGLSESGVVLSHWSVKFDATTMTMRQSDFVMSGQYQCSEGKVNLTSANVPSQALKFNDDLSALAFNPFAQEQDSTDLLNYVYISDQDLQRDAGCSLVSGKRFVDVSVETTVESTVESTVSERLLAPLPEVASFELSFQSDSQKVTISESGKPSLGIYDCQFGVLHIHRSESDVSPMLVGVKVKGTELVVNDGDRSIQMKLVQETPSACTQQYDPVCAAKDSGVRCITTPCPTEVYQTYSNSCHAGLEGSRVLFNGECGELEGAWVDDTTPVVCTKEYAPVCGAVPNIKPCTTMPCPASAWETFGNQCMAEAADASYIQSGECDVPGQVVVDVPESICPAIYAPVCAKDEYPVECLLAPCTTHQYRTFSNSCAASAAYAEVAYSGECGKDLDGLMTFGQPLVKVTEFERVEPRASIIKASIADDVAFVTLGYSGCDQQHFDLLVDPSFMESLPVQVQYMFNPQVDDACLAYFETSFEYDLLPLKAHYQKSYQSTSGSISLGDIGIYQF